MNPIEKIQFEKEYKSSPRASTDLHAGGIFFCVPYEEIIKFWKEGKVELTRRVIERFRPMDGQSEIEEINNFKLVGTYELTDRKYIECKFEDWSMIGLPLEVNQNILTFHCHQKANGFQFGNAYKLSNETL
ncbi:MAG: hypothetical protein R2825_30830 [Saprospiraceae bacterium]